MKVKVENLLDASVEEGSYLARFTGIQVLNGLQFGDAYRFNFTIEDGPNDGCTINGICGTKLRQGSKFYDWVSAMSETELESGSELDIDTLIGKYCTIIVGHTKRNGKTYANVTHVLKCKNKDIVDDLDEEPPF